MSKLRIIGGALLVLFLVSIIAMGVMAVNIVNLSTQQTTLATNVAALKTKIDTQTDATPTSPTDTTELTTAPDTVATNIDLQACSNTTLGIKLSAPSSWTCADSGDLGAGQSYLYVTKGDIKLIIGTPAIGFNCDGSCQNFVMYQDEKTILNVTWKDNAIVDFSGRSYVGKIPSQLIEVRTAENGVLQDLTSKDEIKSILSTLGNL